MIDYGMGRCQQRAVIAVLSDLHYSGRAAVGPRRTDIADVLLAEAVSQLEHTIRPDLVVVLGDLIDDGEAPESRRYLSVVRAVLDDLSCPTIVIPGNHDGDPDAFYTVFDRPDAIVDVAGLRVLPFVDSEEPGYNASRRPEDIERLRQARRGYQGELVALQHVCLFPPEAAAAPYNYLNVPEIIEAMHEARVVLSLSGHHHPGAAVLRHERIAFVTAPALCESPFPFLVVTLEGDHVAVERCQLAPSSE